MVHDLWFPRTIPGALAVRGRHLADVQQRLAVQPQDVARLQVLLQAGGGVRGGDRPRHAGPGLLLRPEGELEGVEVDGFVKDMMELVRVGAVIDV